MFDEDPHYYVKIDGVTSGPIRREVLLAWAKEGRIAESHLVWSSMDGEWKPASEIEGLEPAEDDVPPPTSGLRQTMKVAAGFVVLSAERIARLVRRKLR